MSQVDQFWSHNELSIIRLALEDLQQQESKNIEKTFIHVSSHLSSPNILRGLRNSAFLGQTKQCGNRRGRCNTNKGIKHC